MATVPSTDCTATPGIADTLRVPFNKEQELSAGGRVYTYDSADSSADVLGNYLNDDLVLLNFNNSNNSNNSNINDLCPYGYRLKVCSRNIKDSLTDPTTRSLTGTVSLSEDSSSNYHDNHSSSKNKKRKLDNDIGYTSSGEVKMMRHDADSDDSSSELDSGAEIHSPSGYFSDRDIQDRVYRLQNVPESDDFKFDPFFEK